MPIDHVKLLLNDRGRLNQNLDRLRQQSLRHLRSLTVEQRQLLTDYTGEFSLDVNNYLRNKKFDPTMSARDIQKVRRWVFQLQQILANAPPITHGVVVYRVFENQEMGRLADIFTPNRSPKWLSQGFLSTSVNLNKAFGFLEDGGGCCLGLIYLPPGTRGLYLGSLAAFDEEEFLMPHGTSLTVRSIQMQATPPVQYINPYNKRATYNGMVINFAVNVQSTLLLPSRKTDEAKRAAEARKRKKVAPPKRQAGSQGQNNQKKQKKEPVEVIVIE